MNLLVAGLFGLCYSQQPGGPGELFPWATQSGAWCWYQDPRAIYHKGTSEKTYIGFIDNAGTVKAWSYDHTNGQTATSTLHTALQKDDHDVPSIFLRNDGRITAYFSRHGTDLYIFHRTTVNPEDIGSWQPEDTILMANAANGTCYTHEFQLTGEHNRIYLFCRNIKWHPSMIWSDDSGATWNNTAPKELVTSSDRPYAKYVSDGESKIHFAFTDGHPRNQPTNCIYYMYMVAGKFYKASGMLIKDTSALPIKTGASYEADRVYNGATNGKSWIWDIALDSQKRPVLVYAVFPNDSNHHYYYSRWTGSQWFTKDLVNAGKWFPQTPAGAKEPEPNYSPGISLDHSDPSIVYLSRFVNGQCEVERWTTGDSGSTWSTLVITRGSAKRNVRPITPWPQPFGARPPARKMVLWMNGDYVHYANYSTGIRYYLFPEQTACRERPPVFADREFTEGNTNLYTITGKRIRPFSDKSITGLPPAVYLVRKGHGVAKSAVLSGDRLR